MHQSSDVSKRINPFSLVMGSHVVYVNKNMFIMYDNLNHSFYWVLECENWKQYKR